jgi:hypothetical protein
MRTVHQDGDGFLTSPREQPSPVRSFPCSPYPALAGHRRRTSRQLRELVRLPATVPDRECECHSFALWSNSALIGLAAIAS